jgi:hypothetical protein
MSKRGNGIDTCKFCGSEELWGNHFDRDGNGGSGVWDLLCQHCGKFQLRRNRKVRSS